MSAGHPPEPAPAPVAAGTTLADVRDHLIHRAEQATADAVAQVAGEVAELVNRHAAGSLAARHLSGLEGSLALLRASLHRAEALGEVKP